MLQAVYQIAKNTSRECLRQPIFAILMLTCLVIIGTYPALAGYVFREQEKLVTDGALATIIMLGWILAVLCASHAVSHEIDTGTVLLILSKPVRREAFILGKVLGILACLTLFVYVNGIAALLALRIAVDQFRLEANIVIAFFTAVALACAIGGAANFWSKKSFASVTSQALGVLFTLLAIGVYFAPKYDGFSYTWGEHVGYSGNLLRAIILVGFAVWAMGTLATALSTRLNLVSNFVVSAIFFLLGLMSDYLVDTLTALKLNDMIHLMHNWFVVLIPVVLLLWLLSALHFHQRRQTAVGWFEVHLGFAVVTALLITRALMNVHYKVMLQQPAAWMKVVGTWSFDLKNGVAATLHTLIPNWQRFWMADALAAKKMIPVSYLGYGALYIALFVLVFVLLSMLLFDEREVGGQVRN